MPCSQEIKEDEPEKQGQEMKVEEGVELRRRALSGGWNLVDVERKLLNPGFLSQDTSRNRSQS